MKLGNGQVINLEEIKIKSGQDTGRKVALAVAIVAVSWLGIQLARNWK